MAHPLQPVRGTHDILPDEARLRSEICKRFRKTAERYGFGQIDTPIFEFSDVFHRTLGDASDIVTKETYTFTDRGGESLTLRPEFTASIARAFISNGLANELPLKWWYGGPAFRYERPQKGRMRQFTQLGAELLGVAEPLGDAEMIAFAHDALKSFGLKDLTLELNSLGDATTRSKYREALVAYYEKFKTELSEDSKRRLEKNPLRILDSKDANDKRINEGAPRLHDYFSDDAKAFFDSVKATLELLAIPFTVSERLVRGLDYYSHVVFEFTSQALGAQNTVLAGGRYDGLIKLMGGPETPGVGFALGVERVLAILEETGGLEAKKPSIIAVVPIGDAAETHAIQLTQTLRNSGFAVDIAYKGNAGKRMKRADKIGAKLAIMLGDDEILNNVATVKTLATGAQETVAFDALPEYLQRHL